MRNKIKQMMKKEEGFTLVELLAVIVILGLIMAIAIPSIGGILDDADTKTIAANAELIEDAARLYDLENDIPGTGVTTEDLEAAGYLDMRENLSPGLVTYSGGQYTFAPD